MVHCTEGLLGTWDDGILFMCPPFWSRKRMNMSCENSIMDSLILNKYILVIHLVSLLNNKIGCGLVKEVHSTYNKISNTDPIGKAN